MSRAILILAIMFMGISARADIWSNGYVQPLQPAVPAQPVQPDQFQNYHYTMPGDQTYYQGQYPNPYQNQPLSQVYNPYQYRPNPYAYNNYGYAVSPYSTLGSGLTGLTGLGGAGIKNQIIRNVGQNMIYSLMRGY